MVDYKDLPALWVDGHPMRPRARLKVRSANGTGYLAEVERRGAQIPAMTALSMGKKKLSAALLKIAIDVVVERVLVDWTNVECDGTLVPFSPDSARSALAGDSALRALVVIAACKVDDDSLPGHVAGGIA